MDSKSLIIAPASALEYAPAEVQRIANALSAKLLIDHVTLRAVVDALDEPFDYIWIIAHGDGDGIQLEDDKLTSSMLVQLLRGCPPKLIVINTCSSVRIAVCVHEALRCAVVTTLIDVSDTQALVTTVCLAQALARGLDIYAAYNEAKPDSNREYLLLNGDLLLNGESPRQDTNRMMVQLFKRLDELDERLDRMQPRRIPHRTLAWSLAWFFLLAPVALFMDLRTWADVATSPAFSWAIMAWGISSLLFAYVQGIFRED